MSYDAETGLAKVKCQSQSACGACSAREACGTASLSELNGKRGEHIFTLETITPLRTGQMVEIGLEEKSMLILRTVNVYRATFHAIELQHYFLAISVKMSSSVRF